jgi:hypothetical protein
LNDPEVQNNHAQTMARIRKLRARFAQAHRDGMACLEKGDMPGFSEAIERERAIILEQIRSFDAYRARRNI